MVDRVSPTVGDVHEVANALHRPGRRSASTSMAPTSARSRATSSIPRPAQSSRSSRAIRCHRCRISGTARRKCAPRFNADHGRQIISTRRQEHGNPSVERTMTHRQCRCIEISAPGGPEVLSRATRPVPAPTAGEVLIKVAAAGVNGPDIMQRKGLYPAPPGASDLLGPRSLRRDRRRRRRRRRAGKSATRSCALTNGGGYAEYCAVDAQHCLPIPHGVQPARRGRPAGNVLHRVEQRLHRRAAQGRRNISGAWRRRRHRHHRDPARQGLRRQSVRDRQPGSALPILPRPRRRPRRSTTGRRISSRSCARPAAPT